MQLALYDAGNADRETESGAVGRASEAGEVGSFSPHQPHQPHHPYSPHAPHSLRAPHSPQLCAACRAREARYGFRPAHEDDPTIERPRTLCFECFRMEMDRRRVVAAQLARGWNATQAKLPLADRLETLARRRGRAQIAARHALNLR